MKNYIARGLVLGKNWGGGFGAYPSRKVEADSYKELIKEAKAELKSGGLDSGMGFEYLKGALLNIEEIETIKIKGKVYNRSEYRQEFIGDLTEEEQDFLTELNFLN